VNSRRILYGVLNWGAGHATRSIPVIHDLLRQGFEPVIASDGLVLRILREEFPRLKFLELPSYNVRYAAKSAYLLPQLILQLPRWYAVWKQERRLTARWVKEFNIQGIISDNRPGVWVPDIPSVYITHQLEVPAYALTRPATFFHKQLYKNYTRMWVPDRKEMPYLSGRLGHPPNPPAQTEYIGILSRFSPKKRNSISEDIDWLFVLSGPENQRTLFENEILRHKDFWKGKVVLVRGTDRPAIGSFPEGWEIHNFSNSLTLKSLLVRAKKIILRSGYSSVMDMVALQKKAILVPTPGQPEQEYLGKFLMRNKYFPMVSQSRLDEISHISLNAYQPPVTKPSETFSFKIFEK